MHEACNAYFVTVVALRTSFVLCFAAFFALETLTHCRSRDEDTWRSIEYARRDMTLTEEEKTRMKPIRYPKGGPTPYEQSYSATASESGSGWGYQDRADGDQHRMGVSGSGNSGSMTIGAEDGRGVYMGDSDGDMSSFSEGGTRPAGDRGSRSGSNSN